MEPAAVLVGALKVERSRPAQVGARLEDEAVGGAGLEPDVEDVRHLLEAGRVVLGGEEAGRVGGKPGVGALGRHRLGDPLDDLRVAERLARIAADEDGDRHAPGALAGDAPVGAGLDHPAQPPLTRGGDEAGGVDGFQRGLPQPGRLHRDEPLRGVAEDQGRLRPPRMGVTVGQRARGEQRPGVGQSRQHSGVGVALLAVGAQHAAAGEQRHRIDEHPVGTHRLRHRHAVAHAELPVVGAVAGGDVDEAAAGLGIDEVAGKQRHGEVVTLAVQRMAADGSGKLAAGDGRDRASCGDAGRRADRVDQVGQDDQPLSRPGEAALARGLHLDHRVAAVRAIGDRPVAGHGPGRRCPDHHRRVRQRRMRRLGDREADEDGRRRVVVVLDLGLGESGALDDGPKHRLRPLVEGSVHEEGAELTDDLGFGFRRHGRVRPVPVAEHAEPAELAALDVDPAGGELTALLAELNDGHLVLVLAGGAVALLDLPLDGKAVAVPAGDVVGVLPQHLLGAVDDVLEDLVEPGADVDVAVGVRRAVVKNELLPACGGLAQPSEQVHGLPARQHLRLALWQPGLHRKLGSGKKYRRLVVQA